MTAYEYIRDPAEIYRQSFATVAAEADFSAVPNAARALATRLIHACGMVDLVRDLDFSQAALARGEAALAMGKPILCDVEMVRSGIIRNLLRAENEVLCTLNREEVPELAARLGNTRSAAAVDLWAPHLDGAVVAIGNAPTALFRLLELTAEGGPRPALVIGMPVGFVGAAESKAALAANDMGLEYIVIHGRRGGSALASAAVNALCAGLTGGFADKPGGKAG